jgi:hypothetical protein
VILLWKKIGNSRYSFEKKSPKSSSRHIVIRIRAWQERLTQVCVNPIFQRTRNLHMALLYHCMASGDWSTEPMDKMPREFGPLQSLPPHVRFIT